MKTHTRVLVIGGGVVGCSVLYHLTKLGWSDVMLVERSELTSGSTWHAAGNVLGVYLHGLFEDPRALQALFGATVPTLETVFEGLAHYIEQHFEPGALAALIRTTDTP